MSEDEITELADWWAEVTAADIGHMLPKMAEYSASDLQVIGSGIVPRMDPAAQAEAAVAFYLLGKAARLTGAFTEGRLPNVDSWDDAAIYGMMGRRIRERGGWPGSRGPVPATGGTTEPREDRGGTPAPPAPHGSREGPGERRGHPPVVYLGHPIDNGNARNRAEEARTVLRHLGCTVYDPAGAWEVGGPGDNSAIHNANLAVLERCDALVVVTQSGVFSAGTMIEATDRGRYAPGTVVVYGPDLNDSIAMEAEGWSHAKSTKDLAIMVGRALKEK